MSLFSVFDISDQPEAYSEQMGSKTKFWIDYLGSNHLFKIARSNTGEHWAERVAAAIAQELGVPCASVDLAIYQGQKGTISPTFLSNDETLIHGNEIMSRYISEYDAAKRFNHREHRIDLILDHVSQTTEAGPSINVNAKTAFVGYLVLDSIIGNTDRHHENWAIIHAPSSDRLAPTYDHASSLGRELSDEKRIKKMNSRGVGHYLRHGRGGIYPPDGARDAAPYQLLAYLRELGYAEELGYWQERVSDVGVSRLVHQLDSVPEDWLSSTAKAFAAKVIEAGFTSVVNEQ